MTPAQAIARARRVLEQRTTQDAPRRLKALDNAADDFASATGVRAYVLALKVLELAQIEAIHYAALVAAEQRSRRAQAAGQARAAAYADIDVAAVRAWANEQGLDVPQSGRYLPPAVLTAYRAAHGTLPAPRRRRRARKAGQ